MRKVGCLVFMLGKYPRYAIRILSYLINNFLTNFHSYFLLHSSFLFTKFLRSSISELKNSFCLLYTCNVMKSYVSVVCEYEYGDDSVCMLHLHTS